MLKGIHWLSWKDLYVPKFMGGLGFRDLNMFNVSLLAKKCWRIWSQPNCLLARVLKARYFAKTNFLHAELGSYPSFTWRSILAVKGLLEMGIGWRIGNRMSVNI